MSASRHCAPDRVGPLPDPALSTIAATRALSSPPEAVFAFLADLENHWLLDEAFAADDGCIRVRGPLGIRRTARTAVVAVEPPARLLGRARIGPETVAAIEWRVEPDHGGSVVTLEARIERVAAADRLLLALGGAAWLRRRFVRALAQLERATRR